MRMLSNKFWGVALCAVISTSQAASLSSDNYYHYRANAGFGPRYINNQVIAATKWDTGMELGLGIYKESQTKNYYYGFEARANNAWSARFNSVNDVTDSQTPTLQVHNSASMDVMIFSGKPLNDTWTAELGVGAQVSWVKWLSSPQQAEDGSRVLPKLRVTLSKSVSQNTKVFVAVNHAFNHYGSLSCSSGAVNCFDDSGFVSVTDAKIGVNIEL